MARPSAAGARPRNSLKPPLGPVGPAHAAGQGRLEHDRRRLSPASPSKRAWPSRCGEKIRRDAARRAAAGRGQREALDVPGPAHERGEHARRNRSRSTGRSTRRPQSPSTCSKDLGIDRCLFILGGWTEGGYDCRHPDNLPANPECGGNEALADAIRRIQAAGLRRLPARQLPGHVPRRQELESRRSSRSGRTAR